MPLWLVPAAVAAFTAEGLRQERRKMRRAHERAEFNPGKIYQRHPDLVNGLAIREAVAKAGLYGSKGYYLGEHEGREIRLSGEGHFQIFGTTGSGKSSSFLARNVADWSNFILERKDDETIHTLAPYLMSKGHDFQVIRPHGGSPLPSGVKEISYNLFSPVLLAQRDHQTDSAETIADGWFPGSNSTNDTARYFAQLAISILTPCIVAQCRYAPANQRNFPALARELSGNPKGFFERMALKRDPELSHLFQGFLDEIENKSRSFNDGMQNIRVDLREMTNPLVARAFSGPPSRIFEDLGRRLGTIILSERADKKGVSKIQRVVAAAAFKILLTRERPRDVHIKAQFEEGHATGGYGLSDVMLTGRSYNLSICAYWNDYAVFMRNLPDDHASIIANSAAVIFLGGCKEPETAKRVSMMSGETDILMPSANTNFDERFNPRHGLGVGVGKRPAIAPHDFMNMPVGTAVGFIRNCPGAVLLTYRPWFRTKLRKLYGKNPFHS